MPDYVYELNFSQPNMIAFQTFIKKENKKKHKQKKSP